MSEIESLIDMLSKMIVGTVDKRLSSADFDKSSQGVVTAKDGDTYTIAVFGGSYTITTDQAFVIGQKVVVTAPQGNMKNLIVSPGNIGTMQIIDNGIAGVNGRLSNIEEDYDFAFDIVKNMGKQEDQQFMFWFNTGVPTLTNYPANTWTTDDAKKEHVQDLYLDKDSAAAYQFVNVDGQYKWTEIQNSTITAALLRANQAQDTADGKRRVFTYPNNPSPPYDVGDIYVGGTGGDFLVCQKARIITDSYHASDWAKASKYTDDTVANKAVEDAKKAQETADSSMDNWDNIYKKYGSNFEVLDDSINSKVDSSTYGTDKNGVETRLKNTESSIQ